MEATQADQSVDATNVAGMIVPDDPEATPEDISADRQDAFDVWRNTFLSTGEYDPDGAVPLWMKNAPSAEQLDEWREKHGKIFFIVFPDIDQLHHPDVDVYVCRRMLNKEWKDILRRGVPQEQQSDQMVMKCVLNPQVHAKDIGSMPSGTIFVLWKRIQEASGWTDAALISKN